MNNADNEEKTGSDNDLSLFNQCESNNCAIDANNTRGLSSIILGIYSAKVLVDFLEEYIECVKTKVKKADQEEKKTEVMKQITDFQCDRLVEGKKVEGKKYAKYKLDVIQGSSGILEPLLYFFGIDLKTKKTYDNLNPFSKRTLEEIFDFPNYNNMHLLVTAPGIIEEQYKFEMEGRGKQGGSNFLCYWFTILGFSRTIKMICEKHADREGKEFLKLINHFAKKLDEVAMDKEASKKFVGVPNYLFNCRHSLYGWTEPIKLQGQFSEKLRCPIIVHIFSSEGREVRNENLFEFCDLLVKEEKHTQTGITKRIKKMHTILSGAYIEEKEKIYEDGEHIPKQWVIEDKGNITEQDIPSKIKVLTIRCYEDGKPFVVNKSTPDAVTLQKESSFVLKRYYYMDGIQEIDLTEKIRERIGNGELKRAVTIEYKGEDCEVMIRPDSVRSDDGRVECVLYPIRYTVDYQVGTRVYRQSEKDPTLIKNIYNNLSEIREKLAESSYNVASELENGNGLDAFYTDVMKIMGDFDVSIPELNDVRDDDAKGNDSTSSGDSATESADYKRIDYHDYHSKFEKYAKTGFAFVEEVTPCDPRLTYDFPEDNEKYKVRVNVGMDLPPHITVLELGYKGVGKTDFTLNLKSVFEEHELREILDRNVTLRMFRRKLNSSTREIGLRKFTVKNSNAELRFIDLPGGIVDDEPDRTTVWNIEQVVLRNPDYIFFFHDLSEDYNKDGESRFKEIFNKIIGKYDDARKPPVLHIYTKRDRLDAGQLQSRFDIPSKPGKELTVDDCIKTIHEKNKYVAGTKYKDGACLSGFGYEDYIPVDAIKSLAEALRDRI